MFAVIAEKLYSFWQFIKPRRKFGKVIFVVVLLAVALVLVGPLIVHAQQGAPGVVTKQSNTAGSSWTDTILRWLASILLAVAEWFIKLAIFILKFIIEVGAYNGYIASPAVNIGWVMVRDITNMFFVVILLLIAFGTILGIEQYEWKKLMMKLILAAIIVNFSRTICGLIIDVAQVIMITFINGIAATAGGNLLNMFNITGMMQYAEKTNPNAVADGKTIFLGGLAALVFSAMVMATMAVFLLILLARLVTLWVLIVLSPLAFVLSVIPTTQKYASQWWTEFGNHVVAGPVLVFFIWLSFASLGASGAGQGEMSRGVGGGSLTDISQQTDTNGLKLSAGATDAMSWTNMANFFIAIGMLLVGAKVANQLSVTGGALMGKAVDFGKKVAMVGSGIAAGRWAAAGAKKAGVGLARGVGKVAWWTVGGERKVEWAKRQVAGVKAWAYAPKYAPKRQFNAQTGKWEPVRTATGELVMEERQMGLLQTMVTRKMAKNVAAKKKLKRVEEFVTKREELMTARTSAKPEYLLMAKDEKMDALDRIEKGMIEGEKSRSEAKTKEFGALGARAVTSNLRYKYSDAHKGGALEEGLTMIEQIGRHEMRAEKTETIRSLGKAEARKAYAETVAGRQDIQVMNDAETGKKAAEDFVKELKEGRLRDAFKQAAQAVEEIMRKANEDPAATRKAMVEAAQSSPYVAALRQAEVLAATAKEKSISERQAIHNAHDAIIGLDQGGRTPSQVLAEEAKKGGDEFAGMSRIQSQKLVAEKLAHLFEKREKQNGELALDDRIELFKAINAVDAEAWNDDISDYIFAEIKNLRAGKYAEGSPEQRKAQEFEKLTQKLGWGVNAEGKIERTYGRDMSGNLQNLAAFSGDADMVRASNLVAQKSKATGASYKDTLESMTAEELGMTIEKFMKGLREAQDFSQSAAETFKKHAYANRHYESANNIVYDPAMGMFRPSTYAEADKETATDMAKMTPAETAKTQKHSIMEMDNNSGLARTMLENMITACFAQINEAYQWNTNVGLRTGRALVGYAVDETPQANKNNRAVFGGAQIAKTLGAGEAGSTQRGDHIVKDYIVKELLGATKGFFFNMMQQFKHINIEQANRGEMNIEIDGYRSVSDVEDLTKLITEQKMVERGLVTKEEFDRLEKLASDIKKNTLGISKKISNAEKAETAGE